MNNYEIKQQVFNMKRNDILFLIEDLIKEKLVTFEDIATCHINVLNKQINDKNMLLQEADDCLYESIFTDSLNKPADNAGKLRKLKLLEKLGTHNMEGIYKHLKKQL